MPQPTGKFYPCTQGMDYKQLLDHFRNPQSPDRVHIRKIQYQGKDFIATGKMASRWKEASQGKTTYGKTSTLEDVFTKGELGEIDSICSDHGLAPLPMKRTNSPTSTLARPVQYQSSSPLQPTSSPHKPPALITSQSKGIFSISKDKPAVNLPNTRPAKLGFVVSIDAKKYLPPTQHARQAKIDIIKRRLEEGGVKNIEHFPPSLHGDRVYIATGDYGIRARQIKTSSTTPEESSEYLGLRAGFENPDKPGPQVKFYPSIYTSHGIPRSITPPLEERK